MSPYFADAGFDIVTFAASAGGRGVDDGRDEGMITDPFDRQIEIARERLQQLERRAHESAEPRTLALETLAELSTALEELNVLTEELREQNEELLATQQALETEHRRYLDLFESAPDSYLVTDPDGRIREANAEAARLLQVGRDALVDRSVVAFVAEAERSVFEQDLTRIRAGGTPATDWQVLLQPSTGAPVPVSLAVGLIRDESGRLQSLRWLVRDITRRRQMETQLRASQQELRALTSHLESIRKDERTRVAWEIHDELGQTLAALNFDLRWLAGRLPAEQTALLAKIDEMSKLLQGTISAARRISTEMHNMVLYDLGLPTALEWQTGEFTVRTGINCRFTTSLQMPKLDDKRSTALFGICEVILGDVTTRSRPTMVTISLEQRDARLILVVADNGKAIEQDGRTADSLERVRLREQALALGGTVSIVSRAGVGTTVTVEIPLTPPAVQGGDTPAA
ncbi:MAG: PAS domain S-box protein [candidate division NC10 bacterium]|nr:PAS domain-containing protein [Candidatus Methylomirabilis sp.]NJD67882.1 PAS domain S-box protein [candidate division NC10 bacterium]